MNKVPTVIITGTSGFIGSHLAIYFSQKKWKVIGLVRSVAEKPQNEILYVRYDLSGAPDEGIFDGADYLVHCAYVKNDIGTNVAGTEKLLSVSRKCNIRKNIFLSSFSAGEKALSDYGRQKHLIEKLFKTEKDCILAPGVVLGHGGLFKDMSEHVRAGKRIPLINGGKQPMQTILVDDVCRIAEKILLEDISGKYYIAEPQPVEYKTFFTELAEKLQVKPKFFYAPFFMLNFFVSLAEFLRVKLPVGKENILGLKAMRAIDTREDLEKLGMEIPSYKANLRRI